MLENTLCGTEQNHWHELDWQYSHPFIVLWHIHADDIDHYEHVNNIAYLKQTETLAWAHSQQLGLSFEEYAKLDRAMVIQHHALNYHTPALIDDTLACATWIVKCDGRLRLQRRFQFINIESKSTVFSASTDFVCVKLSTGQPAKMPSAFIDAYCDHNIEELSQ